MSNYLTLSIKMKSPEGKQITGIVYITNEYAIATFSDKNLAKKLYEIESKKGLDVRYNEKNNAFVQNYKGKTKEEILEIIKRELKGVEINAI